MNRNERRPSDAICHPLRNDNRKGNPNSKSDGTAGKCSRPSIRGARAEQQRKEEIVALENMRSTMLLGILFVSLLPATTMPQPVDETSPFLVPDRPQKPAKPPSEILPSDETMVQIHGTWVQSAAQCRGTAAEPPEGALLVTDTLVRWGSTTCSVRDIKKTTAGAKMTAQCVGSDDRKQVKLTLVRQGPRRMTVQRNDGGDPILLTRCPW